MTRFYTQPTFVWFLSVQLRSHLAYHRTAGRLLDSPQQYHRLATAWFALIAILSRWVTPSASYLWPMCGRKPKGQQMCRWWMLGLWVSVCWDGSMAMKRTLTVLLSAGRIPTAGRVPDPRHSCSDRVYLYGARCWEEGGAGSPPHMLGGAVVSNKSKKQTKAWHRILWDLYSAAAPAHATQASVLLCPQRSKWRDSSWHTLWRAVAAPMMNVSVTYHLVVFVD